MRRGEDVQAPIYGGQRLGAVTLPLIGTVSLPVLLGGAALVYLLFLRK